MSYHIIEQDFESFFEVPFVVYKDTPYVSPFKDDLKRFLDKKNNPLFSKYGSFTYFTCLKSNKPIGRIVAHIHRSSNERFHLKRSYFGFFDCADDPEAARLLLKAAESWGKAQGMDEIAGNFNLTAMQQIGVMTEGFDHIPFCDQMYNPRYIPEFLKMNGYESFFPSTTFEVDLTKLNLESMNSGRIQDCLKSNQYQFQTITRKNLKWALDQARLVLNAGFDQNPMFVPLSKEEFDFQAKDLMLVIDPRISVVATQGDKTVGVVVCIPDLNPLLKATKSRLKFSTLFHYLKFRLNRKRAVIIYYSVDPSTHGQGINGAMLYHVLRALKQSSYENLGLTWIADVNGASLKQAEKMGAKTHHRLSLFRKDL